MESAYPSVACQGRKVPLQVQSWSSSSSSLSSSSSSAGATISAMVSSWSCSSWFSSWRSATSASSSALLLFFARLRYSLDGFVIWILRLSPHSPQGSHPRSLCRSRSPRTSRLKRTAFSLRDSSWEGVNAFTLPFWCGAESLVFGGPLPATRQSFPIEVFAIRLAVLPATPARSPRCIYTAML
jgi:hypothetical protein